MDYNCAKFHVGLKICTNMTSFPLTEICAFLNTVQCKFELEIRKLLLFEVYSMFVVVIFQVSRNTNVKISN